jgi:hypothetical protein
MRRRRPGGEPSPGGAGDLDWLVQSPPGSVGAGPAKTFPDNWIYVVSLTRVSLHIDYKERTTLFMMNAAAVRCQCGFLTRSISYVKDKMTGD